MFASAFSIIAQARGANRTGHKKVGVHNQEYTDVGLIRPDDEFWQMARYKKKFGSPDLPKNRGLGHKKAMVSGHKGVIVPGDDGEGPWRLRTTEGIKLLIDKEEDCGSEEDQADIAVEKFQSLRDQMAQSYKAVAQGAMNELLQQMTLDDEGREQEAKRQLSRRKKKKQRKGKDGPIAYHTRTSLAKRRGDQSIDI